MLAHLLGWTSARGQTPFDPITIFLIIGWQITNHWSRAELLRRHSLKDGGWTKGASR
jgi:hypothetical protein